MVKNENVFYHLGRDVKIPQDFSYTMPSKIYIGDAVKFSKGVWLCVNQKAHRKDKDVNLKINNRVFMNRNVIIEVFNYIEVGRHVLFGPNVYICDTNHEYELVEIPIRLQGFKHEENEVIIKDGAWIGSGAKILGNVTVGYGTVVGANSVVTRNLPSHVVAVGSPVRIIKIYDYSIKQWINVKENDSLLQRILERRGKFEGYDYNLVRQYVKKRYKN